jgi:hypothetical protein
MKLWDLSLLQVHHAPAIAMAAALSLALPQMGLAEEICPGATSAGACDGTSVLAEDLMRRRVGRTLATNPAGARLNRLNTPGTSAVVPFAMTPDGSNTNFNSSLSQWTSSLSVADEKVLQEAKEAAGEHLPLPKRVKGPAPKFDVWAQGRSETFTQNGNLSKEGRALSTFVGADYRWHNDLLVGGLVQLDESRHTILAAPDAADGTAYMAGPYLAYRLTPHVLFDAKAAWGTAQDSAIAGSESTAFATERMLSEAKISSNWGWQGWQLSQSGAVTYLDETSAGLAGAPGTSVDVTRLSVGPEVKRRFETGGEASIEPFAFFKSSLDLDDAGLTDPSALNTVGAGLTLAKPDSYSISATAGYSESTDNTDPSEAKGKVSVSVPTSVLGF